MISHANTTAVNGERHTVAADHTLFKANFNSALQAGLRKVGSWRAPPNWSKVDWMEEAKQVGMIAAVEAARDFDPARNITLEVFTYHRVVSRILTCYRREWRYAMLCNRYAPGNEKKYSENDLKPGPTADPQCPDHLDLREAVSELPEAAKRLIIQMFWGGRTESELAQQLGISQRGVSKRKQACLKRLRCCLLGFAEPGPGKPACRAA